jgi:hypothetical protein
MKMLNKKSLRYSFAILLVTSIFQVCLTIPANAAPSLGMECSVIGKIDKSTPFPLICSRTNFDTKWEKLLTLPKNSKSTLNTIEIFQKELVNYNLQELENGVEALKEMQSLAVSAQVKSIQIKDEMSSNTKRFEDINSDKKEPVRIILTNLCLAKIENAMFLESLGSKLICPKSIQNSLQNFALFKINPELASDPGLNLFCCSNSGATVMSLGTDEIYQLVTDDVPYKDAPYFLWNSNAQKAGVAHYFRSTKWLSAVSSFKLLTDEQTKIISDRSSLEKKMNEFNDFVEYVNDSNKSNELSAIQNSISQVSVLQQQINTLSKKLLKLKVTNANRASIQESLNQIQVLLAKLKGVFLVAKDLAPTYDTSMIRDLL